jgi:hypothetical protein
MSDDLNQRSVDIDLPCSVVGSLARVFAMGAFFSISRSVLQLVLGAVCASSSVTSQVCPDANFGVTVSVGVSLQGRDGCRVVGARIR